MPQNEDTGRAGAQAGYSNADAVAKLIGATRVRPGSNDFTWEDKNIVIKTGGSGAVVTRATLSRVALVLYGYSVGEVWELYTIESSAFENLSSQSRSSGHDETYRQVTKKKLRENGNRVRLP